MDHVEEIRGRLSIEELVGSYVQLKKAGRNLKGNCPFHSEKTASFMVSPEKGIAYCFGCNKGGDIFKFIELIENVNFPEAVKILAEKTNVKLPQRNPGAYNKRLKNIEINSETTEFYKGSLRGNEKGMTYFLERGITEASIQKFKLGYAPDSFDALKNHLAKKGFEKKDMIDAAVLSQRSIADQNAYDRFRNRLIFPILDHQGNAVGFSGRIIGEGEPKYLNSPDTPAYNKSLILYGLNWAKESIKRERLAIFTEGYMDVIAAHQVGTENVIATCGTALTPQQLKLISRFSKNIAFAFDQDSAGLDATFRAIELAQLADVNVQIIVIPDGKDPDECIQGNPEAWKEAIKNRVSIIDFYFNYAFNKFNKETIEGKREILTFLLPIIKNYQTETEKSIYLNRLSLEIKTDVKLLWSDLKKIHLKKPIQSQKTQENTPAKKRIFGREEYLLGLIFTFPNLYELVSQNLIENIPSNSDTERFYRALKKVYTATSSITLENLRLELEGEDQDQIDIYCLLIEEQYPDLREELAEREVLKLTKEINRQNLKSLQKEYEFKIRISEDSEEKKLLLSKYNELLKLSSKI